MKRWLILTYGLVSYLIFLGVFLYSILFLGNLFVPRAMDSQPTVSIGQALICDLVLLLAFSIQHSLMARPFFKRWITRFIPKSAERSNYVMFSNLAMVLLFVFWEPMGGVIWNVENRLAQSAIYGVYFFGWLFLFVSTCMISHFDLFGLKQTWLQFRNQPYVNAPFCVPFAYKYVRHPIYVGWLFIFWATPVMTIAHLLFAVGCTTYILIAIVWEERDLIATFGTRYTEYQQDVPMLIPQLTSHSKNQESQIANP